MLALRPPFVGNGLGERFNGNDQPALAWRADAAAVELDGEAASRGATVTVL